MANRVVLGAFDGTYVLRVSRPGYNVLSTSLTSEQLAFDSRWQEAGNVYMTGSVVMTTPPSDVGSITVNFGEVLPTAPLVVIRARSRNSNNIYVPRMPISSGYNGLTVTTSSFTLEGCPYAWPVDAGTPGDNTIFYTVYRNFYD